MRRFLIAVNPLRWTSWGGYWIGVGFAWIAGVVLLVAWGIAVIGLPLAIGFGISMNVVDGYAAGALGIVLTILVYALGLGAYGGIRDAIRGRRTGASRLYDWHGDQVHPLTFRQGLAETWTGADVCSCEHSTILDWTSALEDHLELVEEESRQISAYYFGQTVGPFEITATYVCPNSRKAFGKGKKPLDERYKTVFVAYVSELPYS